MQKNRTRIDFGIMFLKNVVLYEIYSKKLQWPNTFCMSLYIYIQKSKRSILDKKVKNIGTIWIKYTVWTLNSQQNSVTDCNYNVMFLATIVTLSVKNISWEICVIVFIYIYIYKVQGNLPTRELNIYTVSCNTHTIWKEMSKKKNIKKWKPKIIFEKLIHIKQLRRTVLDT